VRQRSCVKKIAVYQPFVRGRRTGVTPGLNEF
jgi:hypothetical protein